MANFCCGKIMSPAVVHQWYTSSTQSLVHLCSLCSQQRNVAVKELGTISPQEGPDQAPDTCIMDGNCSFEGPHNRRLPTSGRMSETHTYHADFPRSSLTVLINVMFT